MAKDKSKKADKSTASDDFAKPSEAPAGGDGWNLTSDENRGALLLITPLRTEKVATKFSDEPKEVIVADVVVLNEKKPSKSEEHENVFVFSGYVKGALRGYIGERRVLGRLTNTEDTSKKRDRGNYYWELEDADADDVEVARAYLASLDPFAQKGGKGKGSDDDEKPSKKKGKKGDDKKPSKGVWKAPKGAWKAPKKKGKK